MNEHKAGHKVDPQAKSNVKAPSAPNWTTTGSAFGSRVRPASRAEPNANETTGSPPLTAASRGVRRHDRPDTPREQR